MRNALSSPSCNIRDSAVSSSGVAEEWPEPQLAVLGLDQAVRQQGWAGAALTHIGNLLLEQADDPLVASYHLDVEVDHSSAMTAGRDGGRKPRDTVLLALGWGTGSGVTPWLPALLRAVTAGPSE